MNALSIVTSLPFWCIALLTICTVLVLAARSLSWHIWGFFIENTSENRTGFV